MSVYKEYFEGEEDLLYTLEKLHERKQKLNEMLEIYGGESFVVELLGLPRTGKTLCTEKVYDFFKMGGITIEKADEPARIIKDSYTKKELDEWSRVKFNDMTLEISKKALEEKKKLNPNIIIMDRGVIDNYIWYNMMLNDGTIDEKTYEEKIKNMDFDIELLDKIYMMSADPKEIIRRDYRNEIWLEKRKKTNLETVTKLNNSIEKLRPILQSKAPSAVSVINTNNIDEVATSILIASDVIDGIEKKLVKR